MVKQPRHRPTRVFENAEKVIFECDLMTCPHCGQRLKARNTWHMRKTVQTMKGALIVGGKTRECANPDCSHTGEHYYASRALSISLPKSTYGLDVLAYIGWQHDHEHRQLVEIQCDLNRRGIMINERNTGKLYRQFVAFLGIMSAGTRQKLAETSAKHGGLIWAMDALQPEGDGGLLYVLYEVISSTPVGAIQLSQPSGEALMAWLQPYRELPYPALATLSDGEKAIIEVLQASWPAVPHQRCQAHFLSNLVEPVLEFDVALRQRMRQDMGGLPKAPSQSKEQAKDNQPPF
jgi:hypothetical protein